VLRLGEERDVYLTIRVNVSRGIEFGEVMVRAAGNLRGRRLSRFLPDRLTWDPPPAKTVSLLEFADAETEYYQRIDPSMKPLNEFVPRKHADERGTLIGIFAPPYRRARRQPVNLRVKIRAEGVWKGWLLLKLPNGRDEVVWHDLPLRVEP